MDAILATAKAWAALIGSVLTALVGTLTPDDPAYRWLTLALAVVTAVATWAVPNKQTDVREVLADKDMHTAAEVTGDEDGPDV